MSPIEAHSSIEKLGKLDESHNPGCYALECNVPDSVESVQRIWLKHFDDPLPDGYAVELAESAVDLYVGRSGDVYDRLMDHARGDVRRASFIRAFGMADVYGVWPEDANTGVAERNRARSLSSATTCVWCDGELY